MFSTMKANPRKHFAPMTLQFLAIAVITGFTVLHGYGIRLDSQFLMAGGFVGNLLSAIVFLNLAHRSGRYPSNEP